MMVLACQLNFQANTNADRTGCSAIILASELHKNRARGHVALQRGQLFYFRFIPSKGPLPELVWVDGEK
jgi:hypothetical protein